MLIDIPTKGTGRSLCDVSVNHAGKFIDDSIVTYFSSKVSPKLLSRA
jgi:hypothetical protein